jgi:heptaprenyl diphosphate synthase
VEGLSSSRHITTLSFLAAVGIALFVIESFIPLPFPFLKIGLANISTVLTLMMFGMGDAVLVVIIRVFVGSLLVGSLFGPGFVLALSGGVASALIMGMAKRFTRKLFSVIGISLIGSTTHVLTQFIIVLFLYVQSPAVSFLLPLLLFSALFGGLVVGWISDRLLSVLKISVRVPSPEEGKSGL